VEFAELRHLAVNIDSGLSRGDTIIDYRLNQQLRQFTRIVRRVNQPRFEQILQMAADQ
jgi:inosine-uridine nucleoside N-ribohydrolase